MSFFYVIAGVMDFNVSFLLVAYGLLVVGVISICFTCFGAVLVFMFVYFVVHGVCCVLFTTLGFT